MVGGGGLSINVAHHGWPMAKAFKNTLVTKPQNSSKKQHLDQKVDPWKAFIWSLSINLRFSGRFSKPTKSSSKDHSFYNKISLKKHHSFCKTQLTQYYKKDIPVTYPKTLLNL